VNLIYIKTFLEIATTRSFINAAENLHIAQSTTSVRINALEESLGQSLFLRSKAGIELTNAGLQFQKYAVNMIRTWEQAQQEIKLPEGYKSIYRICVQINLWEKLISNWIPWIREKDPNSILELESDFSGVMMSQLSDGLLDIGVMYTPRKVQGLKIEHLLEEDLVLISTHAHRMSDVNIESYILVNWGAAFMDMHSKAFTELTNPIISVGLGHIALQHVLTVGGSCYQSIKAVQRLVKRKKLFIVKDAPVFPRPAYMVYPDDSTEIERLKLALEGLRHVATTQI